MNVWTRDMVEDRLNEAADVLKRLPEHKVQGYRSTWPRTLVEFSDLIGQAPGRLRRLPPSPQAISRMEEMLTWTAWLEPDLGKLVWMRAEGVPWKPICWKFGIGRATASRRWDYGLSVLVWRLNGKTPPARRSQRFVVEQAVQRRQETKSGADQK